jgi:hypothetical protein
MAVWCCISEDTSYNHMGTPETMTDHFTASKIINRESQMSVAFICFKKSAVCIRSKKLEEIKKEAIFSLGKKV